MTQPDRDLPTFKDLTIVAYDRTKGPLKAGDIARVFASRPPDRQLKLAYGSLEKHGIPPERILDWITYNDVKEQFLVWCEGKGIQVKSDPEEERSGMTRRLLVRGFDLIDTLGPYLSQINLARVLALKHYRDADKATTQTLICGVYRLLGEYLGPRRYYRRDGQKARLLPLPDLPNEIFDDEIVRTILYESERDALISVFNRNPNEGFRYLRQIRAGVGSHPLRNEFLDRLEAHFTDANNLALPGFKKEIPGSFKDVPSDEDRKLFPYPSFHQREFAYRFTHKEMGRVDLLVGDRGTQKTGAFIYAMEAAGTKTTLVVCPPGLVRENWEREIREKYDHDVEIINITGERNLDRVLHGDIPKPKYIIMGFSLLSNMGVSPEALEKMRRLKEKFGIDSLGVDEVHLAKEYSAACTNLLYLISRLLPDSAPRIAMSGTPLVNSVEDLDAPVRILMPYRYPDPGDFTRAARNDPHLVSALLHGSGLMTRWLKDTILEGQLPQVEYREEPVPLSPFHQKLYEYIYLDDTIEASTKRGMLRQVSLDPLLIRRHYHPDRINRMIAQLRARQTTYQDERDREILEERIKALQERLKRVSALSDHEEATVALIQAHDQFLQWKLTQDEKAVFDEDFLIKLGLEKIALWAFLNLSEGVNGLVKSSNDRTLQQDWVGKEGLYSSKYSWLKGKLDTLIPSGRYKIIVYSGFYKTEVTSGIEDLAEDDELAFLSLYDHLRAWYGESTTLKIDGSVSIEPQKGELTDRERIRREWRLNSQKKLLLATLRSCRLGIDLTIPSIPANKDIEKVIQIFLDQPDTYVDVEQGIGRNERPGQEIPMEVIVAKTTNAEQPRTLRYGFIDHGISQVLEYKRLLSQMVLDGVPLTEEEERFVQARMSALRIETYPTTPRMYLYHTLFPQVRGRGATKNMEFFRQVGFEGMSNADFFAAFYPQDDELTLSGHNAKAVAEVIRLYQGQDQLGKGRLKIASVGAGGAILQRTLGQEIVNIDMLGEILRAAKRRIRSGQFIVGEASRLPIASGSCDITEASLMLNWTNQIEREEVLRQLNRITKDHGLVIITVPFSHLNEAAFMRWKNLLEGSFGFTFSRDIPSGLVRATDLRIEPISWIFNLEKVSLPNPTLSSAPPLFAFERIFDILGSARARGGDGAVGISPLIPHSEFEIVAPGEGVKTKLTYQPSFDEDELEKALLGGRRIMSSSTDVLVELGTEEFGLHRRLTREARRLWGLGEEEAERLSLRAINQWSDGGFQKHDIVKIWSELRSLMIDLRQQGA